MNVLRVHRRTVYLFLSLLALPLVAGFIAAFVSGFYIPAWCMALGIVLCMEGRVQLGGRVEKTPLIWTHIFSSILFFLALTVFVFWIPSSFLALSVELFFTTAVVAAIKPWHTGLKNIR